MAAPESKWVELARSLVESHHRYDVPLELRELAIAAALEAAAAEATEAERERCATAEAALSRIPERVRAAFEGESAGKESGAAVCAGSGTLVPYAQMMPFGAGAGWPPSPCGICGQTVTVDYYGRAVTHPAARALPAASPSKAVLELLAAARGCVALVEAWMGGIFARMNIRWEDPPPALGSIRAAIAAVEEEVSRG